ncbi:Glycosyl hydrolase family 10 [Synechococcus sp. PCC 7335]|nr:Glycosyl hydrolase family 10 [Synechococcus sp. PCC 7335]
MVVQRRSSVYNNREFVVDGQRALKDRAAAKGILYGAEINHQQLSADSDLAAQFIQECALLVEGGGLKWFLTPSPLRPAPNTFDFTAADWMLRFSQTNQVKMRGHTLVWHQSLPPWFEETVNNRNAEQVMHSHIRTVAGRYRGQMHSWDVVNEAIRVQDGRSDGLRKSPWLEFMGPDYVELAFRITAEMDPNAKLVYNDFGLEFGSRKSDAKRESVLQLLSKLMSKGTPVHALGVQGHLDTTRPINSSKLRNFLADVAALGLEIFITELDVTDRSLPADAATRDRVIAGVYEDFLSIVLDEPRVTTVTTWGLSDRYTWLSEFFPRSDGLPVRPLPLDSDLNRKLAWNAIARAFDNAPSRTII